MASYGGEITACIRTQDCGRLCSDAFQLDAEIESCVITSVVPLDGAAQPGPAAPSIDPQSLRGVNVRVTYVEHVTCDQGIDIAAGDGTTDDGTTDDGSDNGSCENGSCDDGSGDDGSGDDGSGDDGSGDDGSGDAAPGPTPVSAAGRTRAAPSADRAATAASGIADRAPGGISRGRGRGPGRR